MRIGTKSVLFGAHCFFLHPWFVALAWWKLYGFPRDPRLWVAFFVHDLGYIGKPNMDGPEGETHPEFGARVMRWFDRTPYKWERREVPCPLVRGLGFDFREVEALAKKGWSYDYQMRGKAYVRRPRFFWSDFALLHSRYYSKALGLDPSKLCFADKLSFALTPRWLYLPMVRATGELQEYLRNAQRSESDHWKPTGHDAKVWHKALCHYMREWVEVHKDGAKDTWTSADRHGSRPRPGTERSATGNTDAAGVTQ